MGYRQPRLSEELPQIGFTQAGQIPDYGRMAEDASTRSVEMRQRSAEQQQQTRERGEDQMLQGVATGVENYQKNKQRNIENRRAEDQFALQQRGDNREQAVADRQTSMHDKFGEEKAQAEIEQTKASTKQAQAQAQVATNEAKESDALREFNDGIDETDSLKRTRRVTSLTRKQEAEVTNQKIQQAQLDLSKAQTVTERQQIGIRLQELQMNKQMQSKNMETADLNNNLTRGTIAANQQAALVDAVSARMQTEGANGLKRAMTAAEINADPELAKVDPFVRAKAAKKAGMDIAQQKLVETASPEWNTKYQKAVALSEKAVLNKQMLAQMQAARNTYKNALINNSTDDQAKASFVDALRKLEKNKSADDIEEGRIFANFFGGQTNTDAMDKAIKELTAATTAQLAIGNAEIGDPDIAKHIAELQNDYTNFGSNENKYMKGQAPTSLGQVPGFNPNAIKKQTGAVGTSNQPTPMGAAPGMRPRAPTNGGR